jgi:hypothetical protein
MGRNSVEATKARLICAVRAALAARLAWRPRLVGLRRLELALVDLAPLDFRVALEADLLPLRTPPFFFVDAVFFRVDEDRAEGVFEPPEVCPAADDKIASKPSRPASKPPASRNLYCRDEIALIPQLYDESALFDGLEPLPLPHNPTYFGLNPPSKSTIPVWFRALPSVTLFF